ncbi:hypothetical protein P692DRAFT_20840564 [Suillus brevipes Sb2]|nr:hypothetical protein P692DRAFT_20840564 [Suillus brevipes Sb2]
MNNPPPSPRRLCPPVKHPLPRLLDVVIVYLHKMPEWAVQLPYEKVADHTWQPTGPMRETADKMSGPLAPAGNSRGMFETA